MNKDDNMWTLWTDDTKPHNGETFLLEWDGSWVKSFYWNGIVEIQCSNEKLYISDSELFNRYYWLSVPWTPTTRRYIEEVTARHRANKP